MEKTSKEDGPQFSQVFRAVDHEKRAKCKRRAVDKVDEGHRAGTTTIHLIDSTLLLVCNMIYGAKYNPRNWLVVVTT